MMCWQFAPLSTSPVTGAQIAPFDEGEVVCSDSLPFLLSCGRPSTKPQPRDACLSACEKCCSSDTTALGYGSERFGTFKIPCSLDVRCAPDVDRDRPITFLESDLDCNSSHTLLRSHAGLRTAAVTRKSYRQQHGPYFFSLRFISSGRAYDEVQCRDYHETIAAGMQSLPPGV